MREAIYSSVLPEWSDPALVHSYLASRFENTVWLDAGPHATSGFSYIAGITDDLLTNNVMDALRAVIPPPQPTPAESEGFGPFRLGFVGWFGYEFGAERLSVPHANSRYPDACFARVRAMYAFDHAQRRVIAVADSQDAHAQLREQFAVLCAEDIAYVSSEAEARTNVDAGSDVRREPDSAPMVSWRHSPEKYQSLINACRESIHDGDAYLLCLTNEARISGSWNVPDTYQALRNDNPSHHGGLLQLGGVSLLSSSPEIFLRVTGDGRVSTMPIKGTRRRGATSEEDVRLREELRESTKERAENLMIVDLMRNDLSRVAQTGTVTAENLLDVHSLPHVHQLVSTVSAQLLQGMSVLDALDVTFPAGSMTGAPKRSAMSILASLEQGPRGIYSGTFGWLGLDGCAELAMVIRSLVIDAGGASIGTGGGITSDSDSVSELDEMYLKAAAALRALGLH